MFLLLWKYPANSDLQMSKAAVWQQWILTYCSCNIRSWEPCKGIHTCCAMGLLCLSVESVSESQNLAPWLLWVARGGFNRRCSEFWHPTSPWEMLSWLWETCKLLENTGLEWHRSLQSELLESWWNKEISYADVKESVFPQIGWVWVYWHFLIRKKFHS